MKSQRCGSAQDRWLEIIFSVIIFIFAVMCVIPFLVVVSGSVSDETRIVMEGYGLFPKGLTAAAYELVFQGNLVVQAYLNTILITVFGTAISLLLSSGLAYGMSCKNVYYRNHIAFYMYFTMLFSGGLVPTYLLISKYLNMRDTLLVYIVPTMISAWNVFLLRNFFNSIPGELSESARLDGANDVQILFQIILPISKPGLATIGLFYALGYWNKWYEGLLYISKTEKYTLQYLIMTLLRSINAITTNAIDAQYYNLAQIPAYTTRLATVIVSIGPIILLYPFVQKYFVKGITVGAVKG